MTYDDLYWGICHIDYETDAPNELGVSWFELDGDINAVIKRVRELRLERDRLKKQLEESTDENQMG